MKKLIGLIAIASVFSVVMMGCSQPAEGDTAPADGKTPTTPTGQASPPADGATK